ncbi:MAG: response regulator [Burkholderiaceae bacterium]
MYTETKASRDSFPLPNRSLRGSPPHNVLLVDDDPFVLDMLNDMLRDYGVRGASQARGGKSALDALSKMATPPELVMCDLNMPGGDGFQFMEELGARGFGGGIVLMSGMDMRTMHSATLMARFHRLRVIGSLCKPISQSALGAVLANLA